MKPRVLLLKAGEVANPVRLVAGDYDAWFRRAIGAAAELELRLPFAGEALPSAKDYDAILVTGSPSSVREKLPWMRRLADWLREAAEKGAPILGVCFGHQLLGWAYGAEVVKNPNGRETGSIEVALTEAGRRDPLFAGLPERFTVQATHEDVLDRLPEGARLLAQNPNTALQAFALGKNVRAVQFHPEATPDALSVLIHSRLPKLEAEAEARGVPKGEFRRALLGGLRPSPCGPKLLLNFLEAFT